MTTKGKIRIIGGRYRGRKISVVHEEIRPSSDRVRETLFNWLNPKIVNKSCFEVLFSLNLLLLILGYRKYVINIKRNPKNKSVSWIIFFSFVI